MLSLDPPVLVGERLVLRPWRAGDASALAAAWADPLILEGSKPPASCSVAAATKWIEGAGKRVLGELALDLVIADPDDDRVMGEVGISHVDQSRGAAMIGWWILEGERRRRLAGEAVDLMVRWLTGPGGFSAILAEIGAENEASRRVAARAGFVELRPPDGDRPAIFVSRA